MTHTQLDNKSPFKKSKIEVPEAQQKQLEAIDAEAKAKAHTSQ